jgi:3-hydroxyacyl-[acyl-carrier-protein] dehydratase
VKRLKETLPLPGRRAGGPPEEWDTTAIMDLMPHRYPFLLVDRITRIEEGRASRGSRTSPSTSRSSRATSPATRHARRAHRRGHGPGRRHADAELGRRSRNKLMYFMGIDGAKFRRPVVPGTSSGSSSRCCR